LVQAILRYLVDHPETKDGIEGVRRWWLPETSAEWRSEEIGAALEWLVAREWIVRRQVAADESLYGIAAGRRSEIEKFLQ
jgi:hypothetical protein